MFSLSRLKRVFLGAPLSSHLASHEKLPKWKALAVLASDALSSTAYATEEILIPLVAFSFLASAWSIPIALAIFAFLAIVSISYRQTIEAYPNGGGAYIVAKENLGTKAGLVAAASLLIDYVLTVSVSIASGVENIAAAFPDLFEHRVLLGLVLITILAILNLRGVRESGTIFALPAYCFMASMGIMIFMGAYRLINGYVPAAIPAPSLALIELPLFLVLRAFASGCTALTGIEAISNGIPLFEAPAQRNAKITLAWMSGILAVLFLGITALTHYYQVIPHSGETVISLLASSVLDRGYLYYFVQASTALILILAANTSYADFPRLASLLAHDRFMPRQLGRVGDRLVFSNGIIGLSVAAAILLWLFDGTTHHLIPLYAVGVFLSFTLSQSGMVVHHIRRKGKSWKISLIINLVGAITTFFVLLIIGLTKFLMGAWMVFLLIPIVVFYFQKIHDHYLAVGRELTLIGQRPPERLKIHPQTVLVPISGLHRGVIEAIEYAMSISKDVRACYVESNPAVTEKLSQDWEAWTHGIPLIILQSPYRSVIGPILSYIDDLEHTLASNRLTVVIPEFVPHHWSHQFLHNQTAFMIRAALLFKKGKVVTSVRYYLKN